MVRWKRDVLYGVVMLVFCVVNFIYAGNIQQSAIDITLARPDVYLKLWICILGIFAIMLIVKAVRNKPQEFLVPIFQKITVITIVLFTIYLLMLPYLGFTGCTVIFLAALFILFGLESTEKTGKALTKQIILWVITAVVITILTELMFRNVLYVRLPVFSLF